MNCRPFILRKTKEEAWLGFDRQCRDRGFDGGLDFLAYYEVLREAQLAAVDEIG